MSTDIFQIRIAFSFQLGNELRYKWVLKTVVVVVLTPSHTCSLQAGKNPEYVLWLKLLRVSADVISATLIFYLNSLVTIL